MLRLSVVDNHYAVDNSDPAHEPESGHFGRPVPMQHRVAHDGERSALDAADPRDAVGLDAQALSTAGVAGPKAISLGEVEIAYYADWAHGDDPTRDVDR